MRVKFEQPRVTIGARVIDSAEPRRVIADSLARRLASSAISILILFVFHLVGKERIRRDNELFKYPPSLQRFQKKRKGKERKGKRGEKERNEKDTKKNRVVVCTRARIVLPAFFYLHGKLSNCGPLNPRRGISLCAIRQ